MKTLLRIFGSVLVLITVVTTAFGMWQVRRVLEGKSQANERENRYNGKLEDQEELSNTPPAEIEAEELQSIVS